jgi:hypothetical protein
MNNYKYDDLTTMFLPEEDWIHLAHEGGRRTMVEGDQADEKPPQPIAMRTRARVAKSMKHIALMKSIPKLRKLQEAARDSAFSVMRILQLGVQFPPFQLFTLLNLIRGRRLLLSVDAGTGTGGISLVVTSAILWPNVVTRIQAHLITQRASIRCPFPFNIIRLLLAPTLFNQFV